MKKTIGRIEKITFPNWSIYNLDAKVDTGAYTSSLHCHHIELESPGDKQFVVFSLFDPEHPEYEKKRNRSVLVDTRNVKSSNGEIERRYVIKEQVLFFGDVKEIELTLTNRIEMKYDILLGRKFLKDYFVDVSRKYIEKQK